MGDAPTISSFSSTDAVPSGNVGGAGGGGAPPAGNVDDLFANLQEFSWGGISFPAVETDLEIRQRLVQHEYADRNGEYVEGTGRKAVIFQVTIPFLNHIFPKPSETWPAGALYPYQWRQFTAQCLDGTSKTFVHPELGPINCKLDVAKTKWDGKVRGGVIVTATFVESDDTQADQLADLSNISPSALIVSTANDLDANIATLQIAVSAQQNPLPPLEFDFDDLANAVVGVLDIPTVLSKEFQGRIQNVVYEADRIIDALEADPILGPLAWPLFQGAQRMKDAAFNLAANPPIAAGPPVLTRQLPKDSTMAQAALFVGADLTAFIALNYALVSQPVIPAGTTVRYYAQAA